MRSNSHYDKLDGYTSSVEILAAIEEVAGVEFDERYAGYGDISEETLGTAERIWSMPTPDEEIQVIARAWQLADADEDELCWGCTKVRRQT